MPKESVSIFWFRRDLRVDDNHGLYEALKESIASKTPLVPIFIFDEVILKHLPRDDHRVHFILEALKTLDKDLHDAGLKLHVFHGDPVAVFTKLADQFSGLDVFTNEDYEPYAITRDKKVAGLVSSFSAFKDQVIFAKSEVAKDDGAPYRMFTPYARKWKGMLPEIKSFGSRGLLTKSVDAGHGAGTEIFAKFRAAGGGALPTLQDLGFTKSSIPLPPLRLEPARIKAYGARRDFMGLDATTRVGVALRFGTVSVRDMVKRAQKMSDVWLSELIWREFFMQILFNNPSTAKAPFDPRFERFPWRDIKEKKAAEDWKAWQTGQTGYPIVDAGMREINQTGFMHNRTRMIVGSFLCKHLLIDWRHGERYFAEKLYDYEMASNVGNWQWVAGCGCDAAPYFRIFNPALQTKRFDKDHVYIKRWVPEVGTDAYVGPIVDHETARKRALVAYEKIKTAKTKMEER